MFKDLRDYIEAVEKSGQLKVIGGAHWELEIGALGEIYAEGGESPMLLFDKIPGYPDGFRVALNIFSSQKRTALGLGLPLESKGIELVGALREKVKNMGPPIPPVEVNGPDRVLFARPEPIVSVSNPIIRMAVAGFAGIVAIIAGMM